MFDPLPYASFCEWSTTRFLVVSENVFDPLIYYSHIVPVLFALPLALLVLFQNPTRALNRSFFALVLLFSAWSFFDLILWAHADFSIILFFWSLLILIEPLIYISAFVFVYYVLYESHLPNRYIAALIVLLLPTALFLPTTLAIESFNLTNCYREVTEGPLVFYGYLSQVVIVALILFHFVKAYLARKTLENSSMKIAAVLGTLLFLLTFSSGNIVGSFTEDWTIGQFGLFGMPVMVAFIAYTVTRYKLFRVKVLATELLVGSLVILTFSFIFLQSLQLVRTVGIISLFLTLALGTLLVLSVRKEVEQRERIEQLATKLEEANKRLKILDQMKSEFVSIASHQLRSPLTSIRGYASMLLEGSFGKLSQKGREAVERIAESSRYMALSVEDYLNVSRIESGRMKYEISDFNLKDMAERIVDDVRATAIKKGLVLTFKSSNLDSRAVVRADIGKTQQIIHNLLDNAMKYTPKGSITVHVDDNKKKKRVYVEVTDTGVGMDADTLHEVFEKFVRARNANQVNVTGTGLGLFVARQMAEGMGGTIIATSPGEGKGSTFTLELPMSA